MSVKNEPATVTAKKSPCVNATLLPPVSAGEFVLALYPPWNTPTPATRDCTCPKFTPSVDAVPVATSNNLFAPKSTSASASPN